MTVFLLRKQRWCDTMKEINPIHIEKLIELANQSPYCRLLGLQIIEVSPGRSKIICRAGRQMENMFGGIHGGVYAALVDTAAYWAAYCSLEADCGCTSIDLYVNNLASTRGNTLTAEGLLIKAGHKLCVSSVLITDESGKQIAYGSGKLMILHERQSIRQSTENLGYPPLPPKFL